MSRLFQIGSSQILPFLYVGCQEDVISKETMENLHITDVINVSKTGDCPSFLSENDEHFLRIPIDDNLNAQLLPYFDQTYRFIEKSRLNNGRVFIHCLAGISRSPALAIAYIMHYMHLSADDAYLFVKERRSQISPNFNFLGQLSHYEQNLSITSKSTSTTTPMVKCVLMETSVNDRRRFIQVEGCCNTDNLIKPRTNDLSCLQTLQSPTSKMNNLSTTFSSQQSLSKLKLKRPTNISLEHPKSELINRDCDSIKDKKVSEVESKNTATSSTTELTELINTDYQRSTTLKSLEEWKSAPLLDSNDETTRKRSNVLSSTRELFVS